MTTTSLTTSSALLFFLLVLLLICSPSLSECRQSQIKSYINNGPGLYKIPRQRQRHRLRIRSEGYNQYQYLCTLRGGGDDDSDGRSASSGSGSGSYSGDNGISGGVTFEFLQEESSCSEVNHDSETTNKKTVQQQEQQQAADSNKLVAVAVAVAEEEKSSSSSSPIIAESNNENINNNNINNNDSSNLNDGNSDTTVKSSNTDNDNNNNNGVTVKIKEIENEEGDTSNNNNSNNNNKPKQTITAFKKQLSTQARDFTKDFNKRVHKASTMFKQRTVHHTRTKINELQQLQVMTRQSLKSYMESMKEKKNKLLLGLGGGKHNSSSSSPSPSHPAKDNNSSGDDHNNNGHVIMAVMAHRIQNTLHIAKEKWKDGSIILSKIVLGTGMDLRQDIIIWSVAFAISLIGTSLGFHSFLYFVTVGLSVSIGLNALASLILFNVSYNLFSCIYSVEMIFISVFNFNIYYARN